MGRRKVFVSPCSFLINVHNTDMAKAKQVKEPVLKSAQRYLVLSESGDGETREDVAFEFEAEWRGETVLVRVDASRYRYHGGKISEWRVIGKAGLTPAAERTVVGQCVPMAEAWLNGPEYRAGDSLAILHAIRNIASQLRASSSTARVRALTEGHKNNLAPEHYAHLIALFDAHDRLAELWDVDFG